MKYLFLTEISKNTKNMKFGFTLLMVVFFGFSAFSQSARHDYIRKYQLLAIEEMNRSGIPASITMAQACLESADGNSELARKSNNHFGIKCKSNWKGKKVYHDDDAKGECFRKYPSVEDSYIDHTNFLMDNPRYSFLFQLDPTDYVAWAKGLKRAGYATAQHYDKRLIEIIENFKLHRLDYKIPMDELAVYEQQRITNDKMSKSLTINPYKTREVLLINGLKAVTAQSGDTYQTIAQEMGIKDWELYRFNDQPNGYVPQPSEVIYIQHKKRKAPKNHSTHTVREGETIHFISQLNGVRLKPLCKRNNIKPGQQPLPGQVIQLR
jgi:LysM repeat protein